jgi:hypothetical protein
MKYTTKGIAEYGIFAEYQFSNVTIHTFCNCQSSSSSFTAITGVAYHQRALEYRILPTDVGYYMYHLL